MRSVEATMLHSHMKWLSREQGACKSRSVTLFLGEMST